MTKEITVPDGYRLLEDGESIKPGDVYTMYSYVHWQPIPIQNYGDIFIKKQWCPVARKLINKSISYSDSQKQDALHKLKKKRALNGDSALRMTEDKLDLYYTLEKEGSVGIIGYDRFYLKKYE